MAFFHYEISCLRELCWPHGHWALNHAEMLNRKIGTYDDAKKKNNNFSYEMHSFIHGSIPGSSCVCVLVFSFVPFSSHVFLLSRARVCVCAVSGSGQLKILITTKSGDTRLGKTITTNEYSIDTRERKKHRNRRMEKNIMK